MAFFIVLEVVVGALLLLFGVTQVVMPLLRGTKLFPIFRSGEPALVAQLAEEQQQLREAQLKQSIKEVHHQVVHVTGIEQPEEEEKK